MDVPFLLGTLCSFPLFAFSNTDFTVGRVMAIGLVVDDAIIVVEKWSDNSEGGLRPKDAALRTMENSRTLIGIALVLSRCSCRQSSFPEAQVRYIAFRCDRVSVMSPRSMRSRSARRFAALLLATALNSTGPLRERAWGIQPAVERIPHRYRELERGADKEGRFSLSLTVVGVWRAAGRFSKPSSDKPPARKNEDQGYEC